ncbi:MAG: PGRS family protein, partial [Minicystis sp.]
MNTIEDCAVFVQADAAGATPEGTRAKPYKTLQEAIDKAGGKRVYACTSAPFGEAVIVASGVEIYGGFDCAKEWAWKADARSVLEGPADKIALVLESSAGSVKVENFAIASASATKPGGSSIAVVVDKVTVDFVGCEITAGDGADGVAGKAYSNAAQAGVMGLDGGIACTANNIFGGDAVSSLCGVIDSTSGLGGNGSTNSGGAGSPGDPGITMNGGNGENSMMSCSAGTKGDDGMLGNPGSGSVGLGTIDKNGFTGVVGNEGTLGSAAQGGGGGGGAKGGVAADKCPAGMAGGASGGSGGSGGCGGAGGKGGSAGGSSIALLSLDASLTFAGVTLTTGKGAKGGAGGLGQEGGQGGAPGAGGKVPMGSILNPACGGGPGGQGGKGGQGGGGLGGHAIGIAYVGA